jgi:hypothetical protein
MDLALAIPAVAPDAVDTVIVLECSGEPQTDSVRLLTRSVAVDNLRAFDAKLDGKLQFGPGKKTDDTVQNWKQKPDAVVWPVRVNEKTAFDVTINYDAPTDSKKSKRVEGDAGKEIAGAQKGAGGTYAVQIGGETFAKTVRAGTQVTDELGKVTLEPGSYELRVSAKEITGEELFRLRRLTLQPVAD